VTEAGFGRDERKFGPSDFLAAERTFLAWIRTGVALMGFGFVVARFGLFLQALRVGAHAVPVPSFSLSLAFGTALILVGVAVNVLSAWNHVRLVRGLNTGTEYNRPSGAAMGVAIALAVIGTALAIYLILYQGFQRNDSTTIEEAPMSAGPSASAANAENGMVSKLSNHSVDETVEKLKAMLEAKGVTLFALVDHSGEAEKVGMKMRPTKLLIFGNPKGGTPLMLAVPSVAIDLPLKILVAEDAGGKVSISYNAPEYLRARHGLPLELMPNIAVVDALATKAGE
jgi:uncharacterized protein (DUF302 family)/uncharacterized membrane protein YidH (DUF202 family)